MSTNEPMTKEQIDAIASRAAAAERGPWEVTNGGDNETSTFIDGPEGDVLIRDWRGSGYLSEEYVWVEEPNAEFIAHAREDIPALLAEVERLRGVLAKARAVTEDKVERVQKIMIDESFLAHEPDPHIRDVVREGIREQARLHVEAALGGGKNV